MVITAILICGSLGMFVAGVLAPLLEHQFGWQGVFGCGAIATSALAVLFIFSSGKRDGPKAITTQDNNGSKAQLSDIFNTLYRSRTFLLSALMFATLFSVYGLISWLPVLFELASWPRADAQRAAGFLALGAMAGAGLLALCADKGAGVRGLTVAYVASAIALLLVGAGLSSRGAAMGLILVVGAGSLGSQITLGALAASYYPVTMRATAIGFLAGMGRVGSIFGPLAIGAAMSAGIPPVAIIACLAAPMAVCAIFVSMLRGALSRAPEQTIGSTP